MQLIFLHGNITAQVQNEIFAVAERHGLQVNINARLFDTLELCMPEASYNQLRWINDLRLEFVTDLSGITFEEFFKKARMGDRYLPELLRLMVEWSVNFADATPRDLLAAPILETDFPSHIYNALQKECILTYGIMSCLSNFTLSGVRYLQGTVLESLRAVQDERLSL
jgi:hypothetical protein